MIFTSLTFLLFLATVFVLYWGARYRSRQNAVLLIASYCFYGWWDYRLCSLIFASSIVDYLVGLGLARTTSPRTRRGLVAVSLTCNLGLLGFFKYFNFFAESFVALANSLGWHVDDVTLHIVLPVGISFYTFQTLSYTIDSYRGQATPTRSLLDYLAFVSFFPQLVAGPIERARNLLPQFRASRQFDYARACEGSRRILWGFFLKMVVADNIGQIVGPIYAAPADHNGPMLAWAAFLFAWQVYFDFAAYSDIAIGTAQLFGFSLMRNFAYPFFSQSMGELWRRWHISLTTWFRDYIFMPLGGPLAPVVRLSFSIFLTFTISGLWHGASWNMVVWGAVHGLIMIPSLMTRPGSHVRRKDLPGGNGFLPGPAATLRIFRTVTIFWLINIIFLASTIKEAMLVYRTLFLDLFNLAAYRDLGAVILGRDATTAGFLLTVIVVEWFGRGGDYALQNLRGPRILRWIVYTMLLWLTLYFGAEQTGDFIYFQF
jgi:D-alanyl-lipoteichoic acid acyltransferase DltB (MBOAT superfamily)